MLHPGFVGEVLLIFHRRLAAALVQVGGLAVAQIVVVCVAAGERKRRQTLLERAVQLLQHRSDGHILVVFYVEIIGHQRHLHAHGLVRGSEHLKVRCSEVRRRHGSGTQRGDRRQAQCHYYLVHLLSSFVLIIQAPLLRTGIRRSRPTWSGPHSCGVLSSRVCRIRCTGISRSGSTTSRCLSRPRCSSVWPQAMRNRS